MNYGYNAPGASHFGNPFAGLVPSSFPPGTDPSVVAMFQLADVDRSGFIDAYELQKALSSCNHTFSMRTVNLLMYHFTHSNIRRIGPREFTAMYHNLQQWVAKFETYDQNRSGRIEKSELRDALWSLGYLVSPLVLDLLISKFDRKDGYVKAIEYDNFIECCLIVKGLTEKFKAKDIALCGSATFTYEEFMLTVLPYLIA